MLLTQKCLTCQVLSNRTSSDWRRPPQVPVSQNPPGRTCRADPSWTRHTQQQIKLSAQRMLGWKEKKILFTPARLKEGWPAHRSTSQHSESHTGVWPGAPAHCNTITHTQYRSNIRTCSWNHLIVVLICVIYCLKLNTTDSNPKRWSKNKQTNIF